MVRCVRQRERSSIQGVVGGKAAARAATEAPRHGNVEATRGRVMASDAQRAARVLVR
jgi:hypothetical protein